MMRQVQHILRQVRGLDDAPDLDGALIFNKHAHRVQQLGRELAVPAVLPRDEADGGGDRVARVALCLLKHFQDARQRLGAEALRQARAVRLDRLVDVLQALGERAEDLPFLGRLLVLHALGAVLRHLRPPYGVDAQVLVQNHEEAVEPALAEALVVEARVVVIFGLLGGVVNVYVGKKTGYGFGLRCHRRPS